MPRDYCNIAYQYIVDVLEEVKPACKWVKLACQRQYDDLFKCEENEAWPYYFDVESANLACRFIENLQHIKGKWAGTNIILEPWQIFNITTVFGWKKKSDGCRRFRTVYIEVPRKNAKSTLSSCIGLKMLAADGEGGAEVYSCATTRDQAKIVFNDAQSMARKDNAFRERFGIAVNARNINVLRTASKFEALSADGNTLDGLNVHCGIIDELHAHKNRSVFDVIETATGARTQSLLWLITTAGSNRTGVCYEQRTYVTKILEGNAGIEDESYFGIIYTIDEKDDWTDPAVWEKANPNYNVSVMPDDIERLCKKAMSMSSAQNNFLTKRLNVWVNADTAWMNMLEWESCKKDVSIEQFKGKKCYIGLDLATKIDVAALAIVFPQDDKYYCFGKYYLPEDTVKERSAKTYSHYEGWAKDGYFTLTPGNIIDFNYIQEDILALSKEYEVSEVAFDPWQATQLATNLQENGASMIEIRPTVQNFSAPMKEVEALVKSKQIIHNGDPVLTWMISNVVCHTDAKDNIFPRKEFPENKIDGVVALLMAMNRAINNKDEASVYIDFF